MKLNNSTYIKIIKRQYINSKWKGASTSLVIYIIIIYVLLFNFIYYVANFEILEEFKLIRSILFTYLIIISNKKIVIIINKNYYYFTIN